MCLRNCHILAVLSGRDAVEKRLGVTGRMLPAAQERGAGERIHSQAGL